MADSSEYTAPKVWVWNKPQQRPPREHQSPIAGHRRVLDAIFWIAWMDRRILSRSAQRTRQPEFGLARKLARQAS